MRKAFEADRARRACALMLPMAGQPPRIVTGMVTENVPLNLMLPSR